MLITTETATKVKVKRAILDLGKVETAKKLHTIPILFIAYNK